jgi:hypothetical protein
MWLSFWIAGSLLRLNTLFFLNLNSSVPTGGILQVKSGSPTPPPRTSHTMIAVGIHLAVVGGFTGEPREQLILLYSIDKQKCAISDGAPKNKITMCALLILILTHVV